MAKHRRKARHISYMPRYTAHLGIFEMTSTEEREHQSMAWRARRERCSGAALRQKRLA